MAATPLRSDARRNRLAIVEAAAATFAEQGLDAGVAEIARRACVGPATLFRHFATKDDLVAAVLDERTAEFLSALDRAVERAAEDPEGALVTFLEEGTRIHLRDRGFLQAAVSDRQAAEHLEAARGPFLEGAARLLQAGQEAGVWRDDLVAEDLAMIMAGAAGACLKFTEALPGIERRFLGLVLEGMRASATRPLSGPRPDLEAVIAARGEAACGRPAGPGPQLSPGR